MGTETALPTLSYRPIRPSQDAGKGYQPPAEPYLWALDWPWFPVGSAELASFLGWYPVGFTRVGECFELAVPTAAEPGHSVLVSARTGRWQGRHTPLVVRTYPFQAKSPCAGAADGDGQMILLLAEQAEGRFTAEAAQPLLDATGQPTELCTGLIRKFQWQAAVRARDAQVLARLAEQELFIPWELNLGTTDAPRLMPDWYQLDEARVKQLPPQVAAELHALGGWELIYGHLFSRVRKDVPARLAERLAVRPDPKHEELRRELFGASELELSFDFDRGRDV